MKPIGRCASSYQRNAVTVCEEFLQPRHLTAPPAVRWIEPNDAVPRVEETVIVFGEDPLRRNNAVWIAAAGVRGIQIEFQSDRVENKFWRHPFVAQADRHFVCGQFDILSGITVRVHTQKGLRICTSAHSYFFDFEGFFDFDGFFDGFFLLDDFVLDCADVRISGRNRANTPSNCSAR
jgi:hypothetical protein